MKRKGLFEWKILAAIFAVLIVLSSAIMTNTGVKDFFSNGTGSLGDWFKSPFGSIFSTPSKTVNPVSIRLISDSITLSMENPVNISAGTTSIQNFKGSILLDFGSNSSVFLPAGSELRLETSLADIEVADARISKMILEGVGFVVTSENTNITAENDKIEIYDFSGTIRVTDSVLLSGNVSKVKDEQWSIG